MSYESGTNGLGVGQYYGPRALGGTRGAPKDLGYEAAKTFQVTSGTAGDLYEAVVNSSYVVKEITLNVKEAFAATSSANLSINGGAGLTTPLSLATAGVSSITSFAGLANTSGQGPVDLALALDAAAKGSATGDAEIIVQYDIAG